MTKILVTPRSITRSGHPSLGRLKGAGYDLLMPTPGEQPNEAILLDNLPGCVGYLAGVEPITARVLEAAHQLKAISRNGTGVNNIDLVAAEKCGIEVLRADGTMARSVAELTIGLILALVRSIPSSDANLKQGDWIRYMGLELEHRTLGIIGCGRIGRQVASMASALGMEVLGYDLFPDQSATSQKSDFRSVSLDEVISLSDILSLHCPATDDPHPFIDKSKINGMKRGIYIVNSARGELLDDGAVLQALDRGQIAGLAIDSYRKEPPGNDPLVLHDRVIATPHIGSYTEASINRTMELTVDNLLAALA